MSKARLVITAVIVEGRTQAEVAATYGVSKGWVSKLITRYNAEGEAAFEPRSRRPKTSPGALEPRVVAQILQLREQLSTAGLDAGPDTIAWHLEHYHGHRVSRSTISRYLARAGLVVPEPKRRPRSSYVRFEAAMPNETWQSDFTHYRLTRPDGSHGADVEIISWLDDCTRYALHVSAHRRITGPIVTATFRETLVQHAIPASTLTDNGMVYTVRLSGGRGGRNTFESELRRLHVTQKNSRPNHPTTCGKVERFQQTLKKCLRAQPVQPATSPNSKPSSTPSSMSTTTAARTARCRTAPPQQPATTPCRKRCQATPEDPDTHNRVRHDRVDKAGSVTIRHNGRLHHIGIGRTHEGTCVILLAQDLQIRVVNAITGELIRDLILNPNIDYQPTGAPKGPTRKPQK